MMFDGWMLSAFLIHLLRLNSRPMPSCKRWHTKKATDNGECSCYHSSYHCRIHGQVP